MAGSVDPRAVHQAQTVRRGDSAQIRGDFSGAQVVAHTGTSRFGEATLKGQVFHAVSPTLTLAASGGNLVGSTAAQATNTCLFNPVASDKNLVLLKVALSVNSGTLAAGGVYHGVQAAQTIATSISGAARGVSALVGSGASSAGWVFTQGTQATLTGGGATTQLTPIAGTTAAAITTGLVVPIVDDVDGSIVIKPGFAYQPLFTGVGTSVIYNFGYTWMEVPTSVD